MIVETLLASAEKGGGRPAVSDPFRSLDFGNLVRFANVMRRQIDSATKAANVGILMPSTCAFAGTFYGALWSGRVAVPLNFLLQPSELAAVVKDADIDTVFAIKPFAKLAESLDVKVLYMEDLPLKREMVMQRLRKTPAAPRVDDDEPAVLLYTSGTSGAPKGVCLSYGSLRHDVNGCIEHARLTGEHRFLGVLPLFHSFGLTAMLLCPMALGSPAFYLPRFQPAAVLRMAKEHRISVTMMIASMYSAILRSKGGEDDSLKTVEYPISGGEALPMAVFDGFKKRFGIEILQGYGMTEASPVVSINVPWSHKIGSVGRAIPGVTVRAFDDDGKELPTDGIGELRIRGPVVMQGYYKKAADTREAVTPDGWYLSGDMGSVDSEGF
ncbi:MAG: AMP-binding protein, partial [Planctomycetota bacterium]|nr:AMP-binding protein [Planctomycetota bacterium]